MIPYEAEPLGEALVSMLTDRDRQARARAVGRQSRSKVGLDCGVWTEPLQIWSADSARGRNQSHACSPRAPRRWSACVSIPGTAGSRRAGSAR